MNYRHGYHAGSFADVFKHIILMRLMKALLRKETPFCYLDTHAGAGLYDLFSEYGKKNKESSAGIIKLIHSPEVEWPLMIKEYVEMVKQAEYPRYYPGSPWIAQTLLRPMDRLVLMELHPEEYRILQENLKKDKRIAIHYQDGYKALKAFLPPKEHRGLILIDPAFEQRDEWDRLIETIREAYKKFPGGIYAIWYPIKEHKKVQDFIRCAFDLQLPNTLKVELNIYPTDVSLNLAGCGMLIINSPWQFSEELQTWLPWLWQKLSIEGGGEYSIEITNIQ